MSTNLPTVKVIGGGLAGCEAAWQIAQRGIKVKLYEMKPKCYSPAHNSEFLAELVCSNSLRSDSIDNAVGLLKQEMRMLNSLIIECADKTKVPAGGALAVDRFGFSKLVTQKITEHPNIELVCEEFSEIDPDEYTVVASGPLTAGTLYDSINSFFADAGENNEYLHFYDAAAPIVTFDSIDMTKAYKKARYDKGGADYINCAMTKEQYELFYSELISAECAQLHEHDKKLKVFEGCMPVEEMAKRGKETLLYGPLKPVGLEYPGTDRIPYAAVQLRQDNKDGTLYNIVGFQTHLKFGEQKRVFSLIPGLENAEFVRYGVMHRNTFINSPKLLNKYYQTLKSEKVFFAGQITGVEGYVESASSGLCAGINIAQLIKGGQMTDFTDKTATGALALYISENSEGNFQPMNVTFGLFARPEIKFRKKREKNAYLAQQALKIIESMEKC